jgi:hypothetical protein
MPEKSGRTTAVFPDFQLFLQSNGIQMYEGVHLQTIPGDHMMITMVSTDRIER